MVEVKVLKVIAVTLIKGRKNQHIPHKISSGASRFPHSSRYFIIKTGFVFYKIMDVYCS